MLTEIHSENVARKEEMEEAKELQSSSLKNLREQTSCMRTTSTPALISLVKDMTHCNDKLTNHTVPTISKSDAERASRNLQALNKMCGDHISVLNEEMKSTASMVNTHKESVLSDATEREASMVSGAQEFVSEVSSLKLKISAEKSWSHVSITPKFIAPWTTHQTKQRS